MKEQKFHKIKIKKIREEFLINKINFFKENGGPKTKGDWIIYEEIKKFINQQ